MIIVNFSTVQYHRPQMRLIISLKDANVKTLMFTNYCDTGSPTQQESPYEFKIHSIRKALEEDDIVLWCDSSMYLVGDIKKIEDIIKADGYFFSEAGHYTGRWTNQFTRDYFKVTNDEMHQGQGGMTMFSAGLTGLNKNSKLAMKFLDDWEASAKAGCFKGDYSDHRHDMTCASIVAQRLGMKYQRGGQHMAYVGSGYSVPEPDVVFHLQGML